MNPKIWLITGCSTGFGRAIAEVALSAGQRVIATARDIRSIADLESSDRCHVMTLDITEASEIPNAIHEASQVWGGIDVVVNNAGYGLIGAVEECSDEQIRRNVETNFFGPLNVIRATLPILRAQKSGHIVNISAAAAISNYAGFGIYGGAKAALELMSESLRTELAPHGIHVTLVQPGPFRTAFIERGMDRAESMPEYAGTAGKFAAFLKHVDGKQPGDPERAASLIVRMVLNGSKPPLRLPLGKYVVKKIRDTASARLRELETWEQAAADTDFPTA